MSQVGRKVRPFGGDLNWSQIPRVQIRSRRPVSCGRCEKVGSLMEDDLHVHFQQAPCSQTITACRRHAQMARQWRSGNMAVLHPEMEIVAPPDKPARSTELVKLVPANQTPRSVERCAGSAVQGVLGKLLNTSTTPQARQGRNASVEGGNGTFSLSHRKRCDRSCM